MKNNLLVIILCFNLSCILPKKLHKITGTFDGIKSSIKQEKPSDIRILIIHGIGTPKNEALYSQVFVNKLAAGLGKNVLSRTLNPIIDDIPASKGKIVINRFEIDNSLVSFYSIYWSDITKELKNNLITNHKENRRRALLNNKLKKEVINGSFSDFVLYTNSTYKSKIRKTVQFTLNKIFEEDIVTKFNKGDEQIAYNNKTVFLITGSLGSKIVIDALANIDIPENEEKTDEKVSSFFENNIKGLYMLTNQIPLLSLEYVKNEEDYIFQNYYGLCKFLNSNVTQKLDFVSFYDPNDLLGYSPISSAMICKNDCNTCPDRLNTVKIVLNNTNRPLIPLIANPSEAHIGVWYNKKLIKLIDGGHK